MNLKEQRTRRRWSIFFRLVWLALALVVFAAAMGWIGHGGSGSNRSGRHTAWCGWKVRSTITARRERRKHQCCTERGISGSGQRRGGAQYQQPGWFASAIFPHLQRDSPVAQDYRDKAALRRGRRNVRLRGYYVAAAADKIFVDGSSLVGSIGVIFHGFGVDKTMEKLGVESRTVTAGENKAFMDPFSPAKPEHKAHLEAMLGEVHQQFIKGCQRMVAATGSKLNTPGLFTGLIWSGNKAVENGPQADGLARLIVLPAKSPKQKI